MKYFYFWQNNQFCSMRFSTCPSFFRELALPQTGVFRIAPTIYLPGSQTNTISIHEQITTRGGLTAREELRALKGKVKRAWEVSLSPKRCSLPSSHKCCFNHSFTFHNLNLQLRKQNIRLFLENEKKILNTGDKSLWFWTAFKAAKKPKTHPLNLKTLLLPKWCICKDAPFMH